MHCNLILYKNDISQLSAIIASHTKVFLLLDENSNRCCLQQFDALEAITNYIKIVIPAGEQHKNTDTVQYIWSQLVENQADRKSLLINIGGGMVTDIGGFAASCYQRSIDFINIPTTLLGMVDAAIGGKTGIDFQGLKNQIGLFSQPLAVVVLFEFLETLPKRELLSGLAEILKYGFIVDKEFLVSHLSESPNNPTNPTNPINPTLITKSIQAKSQITASDANEKGLRKILNFGHTIGHAIETYLLDTQESITHGEGVALGIISALYLSEKYCNLDHEITLSYKEIYKQNFNRVDLNDVSIEKLLEIMRHDKKNHGGAIRFVLIEDYGKPVYDVVVKLEDIKDSITYLIDYLNDANYWGK